MKIASLALVSALAVILGCAQSTFAQTQDQTHAPNPNSGGMTMGRGGDDRQGGMHGDNEDDNAAASRGDNWNSRRQWSERRPMVIGPMWRHRQMMMGGMGAAQFHFARGKARIDVTCSVQEDTEACVRAAGQLIDKIAELHGGLGRDNTTGSAGHEDRPRTAPSSNEPDGSGAPGERM